MWEEEGGLKTVLFDNENKIRAGTINKLIEHLTSATVIGTVLVWKFTFLDLEFMKAFLMTFASFSTPEKFLQKLIER